MKLGEVSQKSPIKIVQVVKDATHPGALLNVISHEQLEGIS